MFRRKIQNLILNYKTEHNISRSEMARRLGVPYSSLQEWENGTSTMSADVFVKLIELTDAPIEEFQGESAPNEQTLTKAPSLAAVTN